MNREELDKILQKHREWLDSRTGEPVNLDKAILNGILAVGLNFDHISMEGADLCGADLRGASFRYTKLREARFEDADLRGADFGGARLWYTYFDGADLRGASFGNTSFQGQRSFSLRGADLRGANFDNASFPLWCEALEGVKVDERLIRQLLYHVLSLEYLGEDEDIRELLKDERVLRVANRFHRIGGRKVPLLGGK